MSEYSLDFYNAYENYLNEKTVRAKHDQIMFMVTKLWRRKIDENLFVIDIGCGHSKEFFKFGNLGLSDRYRGYDLNAPKDHWSEISNYRSADFINTLKNVKQKQDWPLEPNVFVSLFSAECMEPAEENTKLYERLFQEIPSLQSGLISGFYYMGQEHENPIEETGGVVSWQTVKSLKEMESYVYDEIRIETRVPSKMFGKNVVEVWRILTRK